MRNNLPTGFLMTVIPKSIRELDKARRILDRQEIALGLDDKILQLCLVLAHAYRSFASEINKSITLMTLKELLTQVSFDELLPSLEKHEPDHLDDIYSFREAYDILLCMEPDKDFKWEARIEFPLKWGDNRKNRSKWKREYRRNKREEYLRKMATRENLVRMLSAEGSSFRRCDVEFLLARSMITAR